MKTFRQHLTEGRETNATVAKHVATFMGILANGPKGKMGDWHFHEMRKHAKGVKPEHSELLQQKLTREMEEGKFEPNDAKKIIGIYKAASRLS
jgi:hypothetical protein